MFPALAAGASHPVVAGLLGLGTAGLAGAVVAMAWSVHARQIRLAGQLARRQLTATSETSTADPTSNGHGSPEAAAAAQARPLAAQAPAPPPRPGQGPTVIIDGPDTVITGEQARYHVRPSCGQTVISWAAGGGPVTHAPDPAHPGELLLTAEQPGDLALTVRVREGLTERRATKSVTAVPDLTAPPPIPLRLFLHDWGLIVLTVLITGFAGALDALGNLTSSGFIALTAPLAALLAVITATRRTDHPASHPRNGTPGPRP
jgi:hypothetical protein